MTTGTVRTQGTRLFGVSSGSPQTIFKVACATGITGLGGPADQIDKTCLTSEEREYERGIPNPGQVQVPINFIPRSASHQALITLKASGETVSWLIVLSDQAADPTTITNDRIASPGATSAEFLAFVSDFNIDIATNEIVRATLVLQRSGEVDWTLPAATLE